ncbi:hypothetical protein N657DRAFT_275723 [Parathielavia appendiculata]|uniref:Uncharacterized protein n=1 Tax=Parathielavia appendiculata TaxID=2587402 RepID=A0AAN6U3P6_9PEZI|nr:hypothetical protein N657DRAFT_275723 [Parathielavia appendiculata]
MPLHKLLSPETSPLNKLLPAHVAHLKLQPLLRLGKEQKQIPMRARFVLGTRRKVLGHSPPRVPHAHTLFLRFPLLGGRWRRDGCHHLVPLVAELGVVGRRRVRVDEHECEALLGAAVEEMAKIELEGVCFTSLTGTSGYRMEHPFVLTCHHSHLVQYSAYTHTHALFRSAGLTRKGNFTHLREHFPR